MILGFRDLADDLAKTESPLFLLSAKLGFGWLGAFINVGILLSFFSCTLASINATARIIYSMARHGAAPRMLGTVHPRNETPYVAIAFVSLVTLVIAVAPSLFGVTEFDSQGYFGTLCSFGFLSVYILVSLAAPAFLYKLGELTPSSVIVGLVAAGLMIVPFLGVIGIPGSDLFPPPSYPSDVLVWVYLAYMALGATWLFSMRGSRPEAIVEVFEETAGPR